MKNLIRIVVGTLLVAGLAVAAEKAKMMGAVLMPAGDLKFADLPAFPGVQMAVAEGDPGKGPSHFYLKYAGGFAAGTHHHSPDHYVTVVSGTLVLGVDGKETKLPAGSYFAFTSKAKHATKCEAGADCVIFIDARGKWDVVPEESKAEAKK
jgi:glyoxylate utilization-related uncharacterized protein